MIQYYERSKNDLLQTYSDSEECDEEVAMQMSLRTTAIISARLDFPHTKVRQLLLYSIAFIDDRIKD